MQTNRVLQLLVLKPDFDWKEREHAINYLLGLTHNLPFLTPQSLVSIHTAMWHICIMFHYNIVGKTEELWSLNNIACQIGRTNASDLISTLCACSQLYHRIKYGVTELPRTRKNTWRIPLYIVSVYYIYKMFMNLNFMIIGNKYKSHLALLVVC